MAAMSSNESLQGRVRWLMSHWITETIVAALIVVSVVLVVVEAGLDPSHPYFDWVFWTNHVITGIFVVELSTRFYAERRKSQFFRRYWYDILAVIPLFRAVRFLRVLRLLRLFRFGLIAMRRLSRLPRLFRYVRVEYVVLALLAVTVVLMGGISMRYTDPAFETTGRALWFSLMSLVAAEPVGGTPSTPLGRVITISIMLGGLTVFAVLTGTVSAIMVDTFRRLDLEPMAIEDLESHVIVCGWNQAGPLIVDELLAAEDRFSHIVVITEHDAIDEEPIVQSNRSRVFTIRGDYTRIDVLRDAGIEQADYALLLADSSIENRTSQDRDARTVLAAMLIEKANPNIYTTVQLMNRDNQSNLREIGVEEVIVSDEYVGNIMATVTKNEGIVSMLDELLTAKWGDQFFKVDVPPEYVGQEVGEVIGRLKADYDATLLGVDLRDPDARRSVEVNPPADLVLEEGHQLFVTAEHKFDAS